MIIRKRGSRFNVIDNDGNVEMFSDLDEAKAFIAAIEKPKRKKKKNANKHTKPKPVQATPSAG